MYDDECEYRVVTTDYYCKEEAEQLKSRILQSLRLMELAEKDAKELGKSNFIGSYLYITLDKAKQQV